jgi:hypothetical protein
MAALPRSCQWLPGRPKLGRTPITALQAPQLLVHASDAPGLGHLGIQAQESLHAHGKSWEIYTEIIGIIPF